jgi:hypothetical protein
MRMGCHLIVNSLSGFLRAQLSVAFLRADLFRYLPTLEAMAVQGDGFLAIGVALPQEMHSPKRLSVGSRSV